MALKLAFTSCMDTVNYPEQPAWGRMAATQPDAMVLLGDSMYMDYGKKVFGVFFSDGPRPESEGNGTPKDLPLQAFSDRMHARYRAQYEVQGFRDAIRGCNGNVHAIWDDHDFAWNNSRGAGQPGPAFVSQTQRRISTQHYRTWQRALNELPDLYPADAVDSAAPAIDDTGIGRTVALAPGEVFLHLLDGRSFREGDENDDGVSLLGKDQRDALDGALEAHPKAIHVIAVPEPMEKWQNFSEFKWLIGWARQRHIIVICGDVHEHHYVGYKANGKKDWGAKDKAVLHEFAASAMAQGPTMFGKRKEVFGTLDFSAEAVTVQLFHAGEVAEHYSIDRESWKIAEA
jgi:alkaline phosphatase D